MQAWGLSQSIRRLSKSAGLSLDNTIRRAGRPWSFTHTMTSVAAPVESRRLLRRMLARSGDPHDAIEIDWSTPINLERWFVCPTTTPLYYAPVYRQLSEADQLRYNQLTAVSFNELIAFFESTFAASVLSALDGGALRRDDPELAGALAQFVAEERLHTLWWRRLSSLSQGRAAGDAAEPIIRVSPTAQRFLAELTGRPRWFPAVFWVMLALEERSLEISRRCLRMPPVMMEPRYREVYRKHLEHEAAHVEIDCQLIELHYASRSRAMRRVNATLLRRMIGNYFLPPNRSAVLVLKQLVRERPTLAPLLPQMIAELKAVGHSPAYHEMMYSRSSTPLTFAHFDRFPEMHAMRKVLQSYTPQLEESRR